MKPVTSVGPLSCWTMGAAVEAARTVTARWIARVTLPEASGKRDSMQARGAREPGAVAGDEACIVSCAGRMQCAAFIYPWIGACFLVVTTLDPPLASTQGLVRLIRMHNMVIATFCVPRVHYLCPGHRFRHIFWRAFWLPRLSNPLPASNQPHGSSVPGPEQAWCNPRQWSPPPAPVAPRAHAASCAPPRRASAATRLPHD